MVPNVFKYMLICPNDRAFCAMIRYITFLIKQFSFKDGTNLLPTILKAKGKGGSFKKETKK